MEGLHIWHTNRFNILVVWWCSETDTVTVPIHCECNAFARVNSRRTDWMLWWNGLCSALFYAPVRWWIPTTAPAPNNFTIANRLEFLELHKNAEQPPIPPVVVVAAPSTSPRKAMSGNCACTSMRRDFGRTMLSQLPDLIKISPCISARAHTLWKLRQIA